MWKEPETMMMGRATLATSWDQQGIGTRCGSAPQPSKGEFNSPPKRRVMVMQPLSPLWTIGLGSRLPY